MHELSLATELINLVEREAGKNGFSTVLEVQIEVGDLSGVEADAFQSALELLVKDTLLENAELNLLRTAGHGKCNICNREFIMTTRTDTCPGCNAFPSEISGGQEFRVVSLVAE
jgi:hydrogenase nickel incorporation protein HypA/HybF